MTPGQLVKAVAIALDVPEETVTQHDRNLAVAGLRTTGARGRNAPDVTFLDAARLLIAVLASIRVKDSAGIVRVFQKTLLRPSAESVAFPDVVLPLPKEGEPDLRRFNDRAIEALPESHNFIDALAALIADASTPVDIDQLRRRFGAMTISCGMPIPIGFISRVGEIAPFYMFPSPSAAEFADEAVKMNDKFETGEMGRHDIYIKRYGIHQRRLIYGSAIILLGIAFRYGGLSFASTEDALHALLGVKKRSAKSKKKGA